MIAPRRWPAAAGRRATSDGQQLAVVHHLVLAAEVRVLVAERVEAVRAARHDLGHARLVERAHVLLGVGLEQVLVAHPPRRVAGARLARAQDREVHAGRLQQLAPSTPPRCGRARRTTPRSRPSRGPPGAGSPGSSTRTPEPLGPVGALGLRLAPGVAGALDVAQHRLGLGGEARLHHHEVAAQVDDVVHVLDRHRALAHAGAAGHAVPDDVVGHRARARAAAPRSRRRRAAAAGRPRRPGRAAP